VALVFDISIYAKEYKAVVQAIDTKTVSAQASAKVVKLNLFDELNYKRGVVVELDHKLDDIKLANYQQKLKLLQEQNNINRQNYEAIKDIKGKSIYEKNTKLITYLNSQSKILDLQNSIEITKDLIDKKIIRLNGEYLQKFYVSLGEYVTTGKPILDASNHNAVKLVIYVDKNDIKNIKKANIKVDGKEDSGFRVYKYSNTPDSTYISSYRVELLKENGKNLLGRLMSITIEGE
jgi:multidrug resistance efflux pump